MNFALPRRVIDEFFRIKNGNGFMDLPSCSTHSLVGSGGMLAYALQGTPSVIMIQLFGSILHFAYW